MRITGISVHAIDLPINDGGYVWAKGKALKSGDSTIVRVETDAGIVGWGETCPLGAFYLPAYPEGVRTGIGELAPRLLGRDPTRIGDINRVMDEAMLGHPYVKSALDVACWDILGKVAGLPVHALLGGRQHEHMPMYRSIGQAAPEVMADFARRYCELGYSHIQIKVGGEAETDIERIRAVLRAVGPGVTVLADANRGWRRDEAVRVVRATADMDFILEQPCALYEDCLSIRRRSDSRFKLDESLAEFSDFIRAQRDDACDVACIKVSKHGGLTKARLARDFCAAAGIPMTVEDVWGGDIVSAALAHLAASTPADRLLNTTDLHNYDSVDFADGAPEADKGWLAVSDRPGLGVTPCMDMVGNPVAIYKADSSQAA